MKKLFIIPILIFCFSQLQSKQSIIILFTPMEKFLIMLFCIQFKTATSCLTKITAQKKIQFLYIILQGIYKEDRSNLNRKPSGCVYGLGLGALTGGLIGLGMEQGRGDATATGFIIPFLPVAILGGMGIGALVGSMSGESSNESKSTFISLEDKTLDEKINFFKSGVNK